MALTSEEKVSLYLILNKLFYKYAEAGKEQILRNRNRKISSKEYREILELSLAVGILLESEDPLLLDGVEYPNYSIVEGQKLTQLLDFFTIYFDLDPVPAQEFPNSKTTFIRSAVNITGGGTSLPDGGGVGFYLTKDLSGNLIWSDDVALDDDIPTDLADPNQNIYDINELTTVTVGGLQAGSDIFNQRLQDIIYSITTPYIEPEFSTFTVNDLSVRNIEVGTPLPTSLVVEWSFDNISKIEDANTGVLFSDNTGILPSEVNVNLQDLTYEITTDGTVTKNTPGSSYIFLEGYDNQGNLITSPQYVINWQGFIRFGVNAGGKIETTNQVDALSGGILTNQPRRTYSFTNGYPFILIPDFLDNGQLEFEDADTGLGFAMDLQSTYDASLPSTITYNNGNINITYNVYRGEFFYNTSTNIIVK